MSIDPCAAPSAADIAVGSILLVGVTAAYVPQVVEIAVKRSSVGVSGFFVVLALLSASCTAVNAMLVFWPMIECCAAVAVGQCIAINLPNLQLVLPLLFSFAVLFTYAFFSVPVLDVISPEQATAHRNYGFAALAAALLLNLAAFLVPLLLYVSHRGTAAQALLYAQVAGYAGGALAMLTFLPQIWATWKLKQKGSLSLPALIVMFVGNWIVAVYLYLNAGGISLISQNVVTAVEIGVLLGLLVVFAIQRRRRRGFTALADDHTVNEPRTKFIEVTDDPDREPLLAK